MNWTIVSYTSELSKWVYIRDVGYDTWEDMEFSRSMQEDFLAENWSEDEEDPPSMEEDIRGHVDALGDLLGKK